MFNIPNHEGIQIKITMPLLLISIKMTMNENIGHKNINVDVKGTLYSAIETGNNFTDIHI